VHSLKESGSAFTFRRATHQRDRSVRSPRSTERRTVTKRALIIVLVLLAASTIAAAAYAHPPTANRSRSRANSLTSTSAAARTAGGPVITAAGDVANSVPSSATRATARLVASIGPSVALTLGDNQYPSGLLSDYNTGYDPTWGAFLSRTRPTPGNHEYKSSPAAAGYFRYFGSRAPAAYYSYNVGAWHLISLDSNCIYVGGCGAGSAEYHWLKADLVAHPTACTLAYWHHPLWSSGRKHVGKIGVSGFWRLLYKAGAEVVLNGHVHNYERFAPQDPRGRLAARRGVVEIVVGTGGHGLEPFGSTKPNSVARNASTFGILKMVLHPTSYDFAFQPVQGGAFTDTGSVRCH
jgi:acid phosphatase type 7